MGLAERFASKVDRSGEHHLWTGAVDRRRGAGQMRVDGKLKSSRLVAWELANGPLPDGVRVRACPDEPACVRAEHLRLASRTQVLPAGVQETDQDQAGRHATREVGTEPASSAKPAATRSRALSAQERGAGGGPRSTGGPRAKGAASASARPVAKKRGPAGSQPGEARSVSGSAGRARKGTGSLRRVGAGRWELSVTAGRYEDGSPRRLYRTVQAANQTEAVAQLNAFLVEAHDNQQAASKELRDLTVDDAVRRFLDEHLGQEKGREPKTIDDYWQLHAKWFAPVIGNRQVRRVDEATLDRLFGAMRAAGLSRSRLNQAKSLYAPFFRWAKRRGIVTRNPMVEFELPTSTHVARPRVPPEVDELCLLLRTAVEVVPDVAPVLALGAVTGMRRGELVGIRRSRLDAEGLTITVDSAVSETGRVKGTKTRTERTFSVDAQTIAMLGRHAGEMDERAELIGTRLDPDPFLFSLAPDCSVPMPPDYVTRRVAVLKGHLGIEDKRPATIAAEDEALRLFRQAPAPRRAGQKGPKLHGGLSYREIGERLGRSEWWASLAVAAAERRETAQRSGGAGRSFDGSVLALRKFTSSELLDAGFNVSMVAQRQGHGPGVLTKHYAKSRRSADRRAAEHLGRVVHEGASQSAKEQ